MDQTDIKLSALGNEYQDVILRHKHRTSQ